MNENEYRKRLFNDLQALNGTIEQAEVLLKGLKERKEVVLNELNKLNKTATVYEKFLQLKQIYPNTIFLFRVGDFYEAYGNDAVKVADALGLILTNRPMYNRKFTGFPCHALDTYFLKLGKLGYQLGIIDEP